MFSYKLTGEELIKLAFDVDEDFRFNLPPEIKDCPVTVNCGIELVDKMQTTYAILCFFLAKREYSSSEIWMIDSSYKILKSIKGSFNTQVRMSIDNILTSASGIVSKIAEV